PPSPTTTSNSTGPFQVVIMTAILSGLLPIIRTPRSVFEPEHPARQAGIIDRWTTGAVVVAKVRELTILSYQVCARSSRLIPQPTPRFQAPRWKGQCARMAIAAENPFSLLSVGSHLAGLDKTFNSKRQT